MEADWYARYGVEFFASRCIAYCLRRALFFSTEQFRSWVYIKIKSCPCPVFVTNGSNASVTLMRINFAIITDEAIYFDIIFEMLKHVPSRSFAAIQMRAKFAVNFVLRTPHICFQKAFERIQKVRKHFAAKFIRLPIHRIFFALRQIFVFIIFIVAMNLSSRLHRRQ